MSDNKINKTKVLSLALGLPGLIFASAYILMQLAQKEILSKTTALIIFFLILINAIYLLVYLSLKKKN